MNGLQLPGAEHASAVRYYSLGRHAMVAGLRALGVGLGDSVLLPEYICRDLLAAVHALGALPVFYPVDLNLCPATPQDDWPVAAAVIAVDYFGFPQALTIFREYCVRTGAALIEDNAHGFLSQDEAGELLGYRGDVGLLSFRKTFMLPNGAALIVRNIDAAKNLEAQVEFSIQTGSLALRAKRTVRQVPFLGTSLFNGMTALARIVRRIRTGHAIPLPDENGEKIIPGSPSPYSELLSDLLHFDLPAEVARRRELYAECSAWLHDTRIEPVFPFLPENTSPYGFPFRADRDVVAEIQKKAKRKGLEVIHWPDLPDALAMRAPRHHHNVYLINFL
jgi:hypothetical protein